LFVFFILLNPEFAIFGRMKSFSTKEVRKGYVKKINALFSSVIFDCSSLLRHALKCKSSRICLDVEVVAVGSAVYALCMRFLSAPFHFLCCLMFVNRLVAVNAVLLQDYSWTVLV
jgi:hypothetical protein